VAGSQLPPRGYQDRAATSADLPAVLELINSFAQSVIGTDETNLKRLQSEWQSPGFDLENSTRVVETPDGRLVGQVEVWDTTEVPIDPYVEGNVHPEFENRGLGSYLLQWAEVRARQAIDRVPSNARVSMHVGAYHGHDPSRRLLLDHDFKHSRSFCRMVIELDQQPPNPEWPEGISLQSYRHREDAEQVYRAEEEAFRDHWGHVDESFESGFRRWAHRSFEDPFFDPALWFLAYDGDQIAGMARCRPRAKDDPDMGWVRSLSVRPAWRRRGLALALLRHAFRVFHQMGKARAGLGVDSQNLTGATNLYEKAGMHVALQYDSYEKELRPGQELMVRGE
jgi:mycothiol synthase